MSGGVGSQTPSVAGRPRNQSVGLHFLRNEDFIYIKNVTPAGANAAANEGALANFFNSLLTRKSGGAVTPTAAGTPVTQRQSKSFGFSFPTIDFPIIREKNKERKEKL